MGKVGDNTGATVGLQVRIIARSGQQDEQEAVTKETMNLLTTTKDCDQLGGRP